MVALVAGARLRVRDGASTPAAVPSFAADHTAEVHAQYLAARRTGEGRHREHRTRGREAHTITSLATRDRLLSTAPASLVQPSRHRGTRGCRWCWCRYGPRRRLGARHQLAFGPAGSTL